MRLVLPRLCGVEGCHKPLVAKGMCSMHYARARAAIPPNPDRFPGAAFKCEICGAESTRVSSMQRYCPACSEARDLERKRRWAQEHGTTFNPETRMARMTERKKAAAALQAGIRGESMAWDAGTGPDLLWMVRFKVPFSYSLSKNAIYSMRAKGHVFLRKESRVARQVIGMAVKSALRGQRIAHNKLWLDILVQKSNHKGDAVNVVDTVCDAIKHAVELDDRWFSIRRLDWEVVRHQPMLFIGIGQDTEQDASVCSVCGLIKPFDQFGTRKNSRTGVARECNACRAALRKTPPRADPRVEVRVEPDEAKP